MHITPQVNGTRSSNAFPEETTTQSKVRPDAHGLFLPGQTKLVLDFR